MSGLSRGLRRCLIDSGLAELSTPAELAFQLKEGIDGLRAKLDELAALQSKKDVDGARFVSRGRLGKILALLPTFCLSSKINEVEADGTILYYNLRRLILEYQGVGAANIHSSELPGSRGAMSGSWLRDRLPALEGCLDYLNSLGK